MQTPFAVLPKLAASVKPFKVSIPDSDLENLRSHLELARIGPPTYEGSQSDDRFGVSRDWLAMARDHWLHQFDWKKTETVVNSFPQFKTLVRHEDYDYDIHFTSLFSQNPKAIPLIMLHGWPGSFLEFLPILSRLKSSYTPETLPYHIIVPSLPGYAFSSTPLINRDFGVQDVAAIMDRLLTTNLGFQSGYIVQGTDVGSTIARIMGATYHNCKAIHLNFCLIGDPPEIKETPSEAEVQGLARASKFAKTGIAYAMEHSTRPSTIALVVNSNPLALLAWIGEKYLEWTDKPQDLDIILASVALYWFTNTVSTSLYPYRQLDIDSLVKYVAKPVGFSWFPKEIAPIPRSWIAKSCNLVFFRQHVEGGHFPAIEQPELLLKDIEDFISQAWTG